MYEISSSSPEILAQRSTAAKIGAARLGSIRNDRPSCNLHFPLLGEKERLLRRCYPRCMFDAAEQRTDI